MANRQIKCVGSDRRNPVRHVFADCFGTIAIGRAARKFSYLTEPMVQYRFREGDLPNG
jgi:hypothetical protein